jgi:hypothetical protein
MLSLYGKPFRIDTQTTSLPGQRFHIPVNGRISNWSVPLWASWMRHGAAEGVMKWRFRWKRIYFFPASRGKKPSPSRRIRNSLPQTLPASGEQNPGNKKGDALCNSFPTK